MFVYRVGGCFSASPWRKSTSPCNNGREVKLCMHIGGGHNVSVTAGFRCVDFRKWFQPSNQKDPKPTRKGIALNLDQWVGMRKLVEAINNDHPVLATALPCYMQNGHLASAIHSWSSHKVFQPIRSGTPSKETQTLCRMHVGVSTRPSHVRRIQARVAHLLLRRSSMSVLAQDVLPLQHIVHHSPSSELWHC